jgi:type II secretory pathway component GspD/PulD (secretin)
MDFGVDWNLAGGTEITKDNTYSGVIPGTPVESTGFATGTSGLRVGITGGDISVFITALEQVTDITVLANPKILAINKQLGQVYIGTKLGYREGDTITDGGATEEGSVKFLDTGTKLAFRPYIGNDGYIRMDIHPKDSTGNLNSQGVPDETSAELRTNIIVKDGETVVIGGLFRDQIDNTRNQVPLLGNIPIIGEAFKGASDVVKRQEVIVLLTPHVISDPSQVDGEAREADIQRKRYGVRDRLSWISTARLAEDSYSRAVEQYNSGDLAAAMQELNWTLHLRPSYLEAARLRERIISTYGSPETTIERIMLQAIEKEEAAKWLRY